MSATTAPANAETAAAAAPAKGSKKKKILLIALVVLLLAGGGGGYFYWQQMQKAKAASSAEEGGEHAEAETHAKAPTYLALDPFVANLNDKGAEKMAQIGVVFELRDPHDEAVIRSFMPSVRNNIILLIASKTSENLQTFEGKQQLADEIRRAALAPMGNRLESAREKQDAAVRAVQFSSFIIQ